MQVTFHVDDSTQYATVYAAGTDIPVATLARRRIYEKSPWAWRMYLCNGKEALATTKTAYLEARLEMYFGNKTLEDFPRHG